jgi:hypothetical protein
VVVFFSDLQNFVTTLGFNNHKYINIVRMKKRLFVGAVQNGQQIFEDTKFQTVESASHLGRVGTSSTLVTGPM